MQIPRASPDCALPQCDGLLPMALALQVEQNAKANLKQLEFDQKSGAVVEVSVVVARDINFFAQLVAERSVKKHERGQIFRVWELMPGRRNEALDLAVYSYAALCGLIYMGHLITPDGRPLLDVIYQAYTDILLIA